MYSSCTCRRALLLSNYNKVEEKKLSCTDSTREWMKFWTKLLKNKKYCTVNGSHFNEDNY